MKFIHKITKSKFTKAALCSKILFLVAVLQPLLSSRCYIYWHHAPELPEIMKMEKVTD